MMKKLRRLPSNHASVTLTQTTHPALSSNDDAALSLKLFNLQEFGAATGTELLSQEYAPFPYASFVPVPEGYLLSST
jgi:hypothetical protein